MNIQNYSFLVTFEFLEPFHATLTVAQESARYQSLFGNGALNHDYPSMDCLDE